MAQPIVRRCNSCGSTNRVPAQHLADMGRCGSCKNPLPPVGEPIAADSLLFDEIVQRARVPVLVDFWAGGAVRAVARRLKWMP